MAKLDVNRIQRMGGMDTMKISGFGDGELSELKSMDHYEAKDKLLEVLDSRNDGIGTMWACGYGVYGMFSSEHRPYKNGSPSGLTSCFR